MIYMYSMRKTIHFQ